MNSVQYVQLLGKKTDFPLEDIGFHGVRGTGALAMKSIAASIPKQILFSGKSQGSRISMN
jgi:hypothetical protein